MKWKRTRKTQLHVHRSLRLCFLLQFVFNLVVPHVQVCRKESILRHHTQRSGGMVGDSSRVLARQVWIWVNKSWVIILCTPAHSSMLQYASVRLSLRKTCCITLGALCIGVRLKMIVSDCSRMQLTQADWSQLKSIDVALGENLRVVAGECRKQLNPSSLLNFRRISERHSLGRAPVEKTIGRGLPEQKNINSKGGWERCFRAPDGWVGKTETCACKISDKHLRAWHGHKWKHQSNKLSSAFNFSHLLTDD